ncbi:PREDICTED: cytoskeleton-associated protein 2-like [Elephantulus edwardii]|uniref:cytoskeleton-associated protein 2-like n=1 Tax=Elephantulus edwardii TaxID=28737 RepID=UPI0003F0A633|nr:PREDICTED: cytoskeleton-associated protein 2-like [Elephantulus edwardii]
MPRLEVKPYLVKEINKEDFLQILADLERKPDAEFCTISKVKTNSHNPVKGRLLPKQTLSKSFTNSAILKDRANKQCFEKNINQESTSKITATCTFAHEQIPKHTKPRTYTTLLQGIIDNRYTNIKQDQKSLQPFRVCASYACTPFPMGPIIINVTAFNKKAQTLDSKLKKALSQNEFLNNKTQANPDINKKVIEDRRKQLEKWKKAKREIYKLPLMEPKAKTNKKYECFLLEEH